MARGGPRKAGGASKKKVTQRVLEDQSDATVPPMPDPEIWVPIPQGPAEETEPGMETDWAEPVKLWWNSIWTSPMSSEFVESDIHGLYVACVYLHESLNPYYKLTDRIKSMQAFESTIKNYGLTPTARESLRWQVAQGTQAQNRTDQIRSQQKAETRTQAAKNANPQANVIDLYGSFG